MTLIVTAFFTENGGEPKTGLTLGDIELYLTARKRSDGSTTVIWDGTQHPSEEIDNVGAYTKAYTDDNTTVYDYFGMAHYAGAEDLDYDDVTAGLGELGSRVWGWTPRTITSSAAEVADAVSGSDQTIRRGDTFIASITGLGTIANRSKLWYTVKRRLDGADKASLVRIEETVGLEYIVGRDASTPENGSITVDDEDAGDITIKLEAAETKKLPPINNIYFDVQVLTTDGDVSTLSAAAVDIEGDVGRVTS